MSDTQKTTKAAKEAEEASENTSKAQDEALFTIAQRNGGGCAIVKAETAILVNAADGTRFRVAEDGEIHHVPSFNALYEAGRTATSEDLGLDTIQPHYTVELTTEGWQIKDNVKSFILAGFYVSRGEAQEEVDHFNQIDAAKKATR